MTKPPFRHIWRATLAGAALASAAAHGAEAPAHTDAERLLQERDSEFEQAVIEVARGVYTAVGFGVSPSSMIVGETGVVIVDTQIDAPAARAVLDAFRAVTDAPVAAIVLTHGHNDHTGGLAVFAAEAAGSPEIWAGSRLPTRIPLPGRGRSHRATPAGSPPSRFPARTRAAHQQRHRPGLPARVPRTRGRRRPHAHPHGAAPHARHRRRPAGPRGWPRARPPTRSIPGIPRAKSCSPATTSTSPGQTSTRSGARPIATSMHGRRVSTRCSRRTPHTWSGDTRGRCSVASACTRS